MYRYYIYNYIYIYIERIVGAEREGARDTSREPAEHTRFFSYIHTYRYVWTVPRAQALLRGRAWVAQLWAKSVGAVRLRALPFFLVQ